MSGGVGSEVGCNRHLSTSDNVGSIEGWLDPVVGDELPRLHLICPPRRGLRVPERGGEGGGSIWLSGAVKSTEGVGYLPTARY